MSLLKTDIGRLRLIGFLEGVSFLLLVGLGMPLKYYGGYPHATQELGMAHGVLFILYIFAVFPAMKTYKWSLRSTIFVLLASVFPLGTFIAEYRFFKHYAA